MEEGNHLILPRKVQDHLPLLAITDRLPKNEAERMGTRK
jgi:hypothetical protein